MRYFIFLISFLFYVSNEEQNKFIFKCFDDNCSEPLLHGHAAQRFIADDKIKLNANPRDPVKVFGISKDGELDYYLVKKHGEEKLFPCKMFKTVTEVNKPRVEVIRHFPKIYAKNKGGKENQERKSSVNQSSVLSITSSSFGPQNGSQSQQSSKRKLFLDVVLANQSSQILQKTDIDSELDINDNKPRVLHGDKVGETPEYSNINVSSDATSSDKSNETLIKSSSNPADSDPMDSDSIEEIIADEDIMENITTKTYSHENESLAVANNRTNTPSLPLPESQEEIISNKDITENISTKENSLENESLTAANNLTSTPSSPESKVSDIEKKDEKQGIVSPKIPSIEESANENIKMKVDNSGVKTFENERTTLGAPPINTESPGKISGLSNFSGFNRKVESVIETLITTNLDDDLKNGETKNQEVNAHNSPNISSNVSNEKPLSDVDFMSSDDENNSSGISATFENLPPPKDVSNSSSETAARVSENAPQTNSQSPNVIAEPSMTAQIANKLEDVDQSIEKHETNESHLTDTHDSRVKAIPTHQPSEIMQNISTSSLPMDLNSNFQDNKSELDTYEHTISDKVNSVSLKDDNTLFSENNVASNKDRADSENVFQAEEQNTDQNLVNEEQNFYHQMLSYVSGMISFWSSSFERKLDTREEYCDTENCDAILVKDDIGIQNRFIHIPLVGEMPSIEKEWFVACGSVLLVTLCFCIILYAFNCGQSSKKVNNLVGLVNRLENKLLVASKEILSLQDELDSNKTSSPNITRLGSLSSEKVDAIKDVFNKQLKQYQEKNMKLEDTVSYLEKELENVSNSALEMHKLLENSLVNQSTSRATIDEVDELRTLSVKQEAEIEDLRREMDSVLIENQMLKENYENAKANTKKLESDYHVQIKKNFELSENQKELTFRLDKELEKYSDLENQSKSEIYQLKSKIEDLEMTLKTTEFQVQALNRAMDEKIGDSLETKDYVQMKLRTSTLEAMNTELNALLKGEKGARRMVEEHMGNVIKELNNVKKSFELSEKERNEAVTKVQVLTDFFKAELAKLQKELETKEKLFAENENKDQLLSQQLHLLKEEVKNQKLQNEALKKEIRDQEASYKIQLANSEQKQHEHWFAFRQSDRKYKECQQEAASLRNKILLLETNLASLNNSTDKIMNGMNDDLDVPTPQLLLSDSIEYSDDFVPPPPSPPMLNRSELFIPPEPLYFADERLPPLGSRRVSSPPNSIPLDEDDLIPPPPMPPYFINRSRNESSYSTSFIRTPPPLNRPRQMKQRHNRNSADSPSSGVSLESLDKSGR